MAPSLRWDIFCRVVDNFGDAGVCWRLARQLAHEHGIAVTLWIDDVGSLARFVPGVAADTRGPGRGAACACAGWPQPLPADVALPDVVIEGFGCGLPGALCRRDGRSAAQPPVWVVLEYLSAEPWIDASHGLPSPHPQLPLTRWFWFPGFTPKTGGVLREEGLLDARDAFRADAAARGVMWRARAIVPAARGAAASRCSAMRIRRCPRCSTRGPKATSPSRASCRKASRVRNSTASPAAPCRMPARRSSRGRLTLAVVPFVDQDAFDRRLWACDLNFVRGEDSFVRAQWAGQPYVWHIYPQDGDAHLTKMDAFLTRLEASLPDGVRIGQRAFWYAWNVGRPGSRPPTPGPATAASPRSPCWPGPGRARWPASTDLAEGLVKFCESRL